MNKNFYKDFGCYCLMNAAKLPSEITFPTLIKIHNFNVIFGSSKLKEAKRIIAYIVLYTWLGLVMRKHKKVQIHDA